MRENRLILLISGQSMASIRALNEILKLSIRPPLQAYEMPCTTFDLDKVRRYPNIGACHIGIHGHESQAFYDQVRDLAFTKHRQSLPFAQPVKTPPVNVVMTCSTELLQHAVGLHHSGLTQQMHLIMLNKPKCSEAKLELSLDEALKEHQNIEYKV